jgi:dienelactone hydrolase
MNTNVSRQPLPELREVRLIVPDGELGGALAIPKEAQGIVLFAHGSGSSRHSPRNRYVAEVLQRAGLATLLMDLLTRDEEAIDQYTRQFRFDIGLLAERLTGAIDWLAAQRDTRALPIGLFGASTGVAAALRAAAARPDMVRAVVSRGGRPDLAGDALPRVQAPTLLIVGADDTQVISLNEAARQQMRAPTELVLVPGATHLFEEPGTLAEAAGLARDWFVRFVVPEAAAVSVGTARESSA